MKAIYFGAEWCGQCKVFKPRFIDHCGSNEIEYQVVDIEEDEKMVQKYGIRNIPYVILLDEQEEVALRGMASEIIDLI